MPRRNSGCESCFSTLILVGLSLAIVYWDYETLAHLQLRLSPLEHIRQVWTVAMKLTLTYIWFSIPLLIAMAITRHQRATDCVSRGVLLVAGPNLLLWNVVGSCTETIRPESLCQKKDVCEGQGALALCVIAWVFLYILAGVCTLVLVKLLRSARTPARPQRISVRYNSVSEKSMKRRLITHNSEEVCTVCLDHFQKGDSTQMLVSCKHQFHQKCIESWLQYSHSCPVCRGAC
jgi:hypothetical protein